jgi:hypothetical protein
MSSAWSRGPQQWRWAAVVGTHAGGGLSCLYGLPGRERVRREAALRPGAATKAWRWMSRRSPQLVALAAHGRRGGRCGTWGRRQRGRTRAVGRPSGDAWARAVDGCGARALRRWWAAGAETEQRGSEGDRGRRSSRSQKDLVEILESSRDSSVKKEFPLIQNPSEKNV